MQPLIETQAESDEFVSLAIRYLDPDSQMLKRKDIDRDNLDAMITLFLLLGGVIVCFAIMLFHMRG